MAKIHKIPLGQFVVVNIKEEMNNGCWLKGKAKLIVVGHHRDCDGTPLYALCSEPIKAPNNTESNLSFKRIPAFFGVFFQKGFIEKDLTVIKEKRVEIVYRSVQEFLRKMQTS